MHICAQTTMDTQLYSQVQANRYNWEVYVEILISIHELEKTHQVMHKLLLQETPANDCWDFLSFYFTGCILQS